MDLNQGPTAGLLADYFSRGGTFKELKNLSEDSMEAIYSVAFNLYQGGRYDEAKRSSSFSVFTITTTRNTSWGWAPAR